MAAEDELVLVEGHIRVVPNYTLYVEVECGNEHLPASIDRWGLKELLRDMVKGIDMGSMANAKRTRPHQLARFKARVGSEAHAATVAEKLDGVLIRLQGIPGEHKVSVTRAVEPTTSTSNTANTNSNNNTNSPGPDSEWLSFFSMESGAEFDSQKPGHRPDTLVIEGLPVQWFGDAAAAGAVDIVSGIRADCSSSLTDAAAAVGSVFSHAFGPVTAVGIATEAVEWRGSSSQAGGSGGSGSGGNSSSSTGASARDALNAKLGIDLGFLGGSVLAATTPLTVFVQFGSYAAFAAAVACLGHGKSLHSLSLQRFVDLTDIGWDASGYMAVDLVRKRRFAREAEVAAAEKAEREAKAEAARLAAEKAARKEERRRKREEKERRREERRRLQAEEDARRRAEEEAAVAAAAEAERIRREEEERLEAERQEEARRLMRARLAEERERYRIEQERLAAEREAAALEAVKRAERERAEREAAELLEMQKRREAIAAEIQRQEAAEKAREEKKAAFKEKMERVKAARAAAAAAAGDGGAGAVAVAGSSERRSSRRGMGSESEDASESREDRIKSSRLAGRLQVKGRDGSGGEQVSERRHREEPDRQRVGRERRSASRSPARSSSAARDASNSRSRSRSRSQSQSRRSRKRSYSPDNSESDERGAKRARPSSVVVVSKPAARAPSRSSTSSSSVFSRLGKRQLGSINKALEEGR